MEAVSSVRITALGSSPLPCRNLPVGNGTQSWADHTATSPRGNVRGMFLVAQLDVIHAEIVDFGHKDAT
jgi:hypothetical protein